MKGLMRRIWAKVMSPVPQDPTEIILGKYGGALVRLRPVIDNDRVITDWVPDPETVARLNMPDADAAPPPLPGDAPPNPAPPPLPGDAPPNPTPQIGDPGGFNPAGVGGL